MTFTHNMRNLKGIVQKKLVTFVKVLRKDRKVNGSLKENSLKNCKIYIFKGEFRKLKKKWT